MTLRELPSWIRADLTRYAGQAGWRAFFRTYLFGEEGFRFSFWFRVHTALQRRRWLLPLRLVSHWFLYHYRYKYGFAILPGTAIGKGLYLGHFGGVVINPRACIGANCNLSPHVTIGQTNRGQHPGVPVIGDRVFIGAGAVVIGGIHVGNDVAIGPNAVVTRDVPDSAVVVGIPATVISQAGSAGYVNHQATDAT